MGRGREEEHERDLLMCEGKERRYSQEGRQVGGSVHRLVRLCRRDGGQKERPEYEEDDSRFCERLFSWEMSLRNAGSRAQCAVEEGVLGGVA